MADNNDDLVMESTTDTPDIVEASMAVQLRGPEEAAREEDYYAPAGLGVETPADEQVEAAPAEGEAAVEEPVGEVTPEPVVAKAARQGRPQRKAADAAAAAARRKADAEAAVLKEENAALKRRLDELATGRVTPAPAGGTPAAQPALAPVEVAASDVPDSHPAVAAALAKVTALGAKPKQTDFADFDEFEAKKDEWIEQRAMLRAKAESVREDVARRASIAQTEANRAAHQTATAFQATVAAARARHADYDDKMEQARQAGWVVNDDLRTAMMESPVGGDLAHYLVSHPQELQRINGLSPHRAIVELGIIEGRIQATMKAPAVTPAASTQRQVARTTKAPEPQKTTLGDFASEVTPLDLNDPGLSQAQYNRLRDQMDRESGRRMH